MLKSNLIKIMKDRKITVRELAEKAHVSPVTIIKARKKIEDCKVSSLIKITDALNIEINDILKK